jgi:SPP1 gp7 family putative phage head morphogenesis protein
MNISDQLYDLTMTRALVLQRVANGLSREVADLYLNMINDVTKQLKSGNDINIINMNKIIKEMKTNMQVNLNITDDLTKLGMSEAQWSSSIVNGAISVDIMAKLPMEATIASIASKSMIQGAYINEWFKSIDDSMQLDLSKAIRLGVTMGEDTPTITKRVKDTLLVNVNHAKTIARTAIASVSNDVRMKVWEDNSDIIKTVSFHAVIDGRTSFGCATRDHSEYDVITHEPKNDKAKQFPYQPVPRHPNCRSTYVPVTKSFKELTGLDIEIPSGTRASMDGQIPSEISFDKWFEGKDSKFQEKYLGKGRYKLYKSGKITFNDLVNQNGMELKISELK